MLTNLRNKYSLIKYIISQYIHLDIFDSILETYCDIIHEDIYYKVQQEIKFNTSKFNGSINMINIFCCIQSIYCGSTLIDTSLICQHCKQRCSNYILILSKYDQYYSLEYCLSHFIWAYDDYKLFSRFLQRYYPIKVM